jgi:hypothetical protein
MKAEEARDYWRWRMFRQVAEYIHEPDDSNKMKLLSLLDAYRQEQSTQDPLNVQECSANAM